MPGANSNELRADEVSRKKETFLYGPSLGVGPAYPAGELGLVYINADEAIVTAERNAQLAVSRGDGTQAMANAAKYNGLKTLDDYTRLYDHEWQNSSRPTGQDSGILTNYTQDLLFSMERLSVNPYAVRRLLPLEELPFAVEDATIRSMAGQPLRSLLDDGRLFYVDHRNQSTYNRTDKFGAACDAYFYISPSSGDFLPLAIRTNVGSNLIYTPNDSPTDWLLAKMMFNVNDFFMAQIDHLARTHSVAEILYQAAIRSLSDKHPVLAILKRLMYGAFGIRPLAMTILFNPGAAIDRFFPWTGTAATQFNNDTYANGYAGAFHANWIRNNLRRRGLIDCAHGPPLKDFPFYEDAGPIVDAIHRFTRTLVSSYYPNNAAIRADPEVRAWLAELTGNGEVIDFPPIDTRSDLANVLAEVARLVSVTHHAVNTNELITSSGTLPFHPTALYQPIPTEKGITNVVPWLPPLNQSLRWISVSANFARPLLAGTNRSIVHMFDDDVMLGRMNEDTRRANDRFMETMRARSRVVKSRGFGKDGLSQGMPFVWNALDPDIAPWSSTI